jgi:hypothetical protein
MSLIHIELYEAYCSFREEVEFNGYWTTHIYAPLAPLDMANPETGSMKMGWYLSAGPSQNQGPGFLMGWVGVMTHFEPAEIGVTLEEHRRVLAGAWSKVRDQLRAREETWVPWGEQYGTGWW